MTVIFRKHHTLVEPLLLTNQIFLWHICYLIYSSLSVQQACGMSSISNQVLQSLLTRRTTIRSRKRFMTQLCTLCCLLSHKTSANPIKNLAEPLPHLFRPEASCRDNSLGTSSLKPALEQKQFASLLIFIHLHLAIRVSCVSQTESFSWFCTISKAGSKPTLCPEFHKHSFFCTPKLM